MLADASNPYLAAILSNNNYNILVNEIEVIGAPGGATTEDDAMSSSSGISSSSLSNSSLHHRERAASASIKMLDEILEEDRDSLEGGGSSVSCMDNVDEVKRINGKNCLAGDPEKEDLILHLVGSNNLVKFGGSHVKRYAPVLCKQHFIFCS